MLPFTFSNELIPKQPSVTHTNELYITSFITSSPSTNIKLVTRSAIANNTITTNDANPTIFFSFISFFSLNKLHIIYLLPPKYSVACPFSIKYSFNDLSANSPADHISPNILPYLPLAS